MVTNFKDCKTGIVNLERVDSPYLIKIHKVIQGAEDFKILVEHMPNGTMFDYILNYGYENQATCALVMYEIISGLLALAKWQKYPYDITVFWA